MAFTKTGHFVQGHSNWRSRSKRSLESYASPVTHCEDGPNTHIHVFYQEADGSTQARIRSHYNIPCDDDGFCFDYLKVIHHAGLTDNINPVSLNDAANKIATNGLT